jgi:hypothetical protein
MGKVKSLDAKGAKLAEFRKVEQATAEADPYGMTARKTKARTTTKS